MASKAAKHADEGIAAVRGAAAAADEGANELFQAANKVDEVGGCFLPGQFVADLEIRPEPLLAAGVAGQKNDSEDDRLNAWILSLIAAGVAIAAIRLEKRRLQSGPVAAQRRHVVMLDELFSSEAPWEPQAVDQRGEPGFV